MTQHNPTIGNYTVGNITPTTTEPPPMYWVIGGEKYKLVGDGPLEITDDMIGKRVDLWGIPEDE